MENQQPIQPILISLDSAEGDVLFGTEQCSGAAFRPPFPEHSSYTCSWVSATLS